MSKIPPDLTHMPSNIKQMIVNSSDTKTKLCQRALSQEFKCEVDKAPIRYFELKMVIFNDLVQISRRITERGYMILLDFWATSNGYFMTNFEERYEKRMEGDFRKAAVAKLLRIFKHSKVSVVKLRIEGHFREWHVNNAVVLEEFNRILSQKPFQLRIEKLTFDLECNQQQILSVLRYLKPITLKRLELWGPRRRNERLDIDEIVQTDQWMGLKRVHFYYFEIEISLEKMSHLNNVVIRLATPPTETIVRILETFLHRPKLVHLTLCWSVGMDMTRAKEYLRRFEKIREEWSEDEYCLRLPYEGGYNIVYITITEYSVTIEKQNHFQLP